MAEEAPQIVTPDERTVDRLTALILTAPQNNRNYTASKDMAAWIVAEARRVGWSLTIEGEK